jgi:hypothetical protein
MPSFVYFLAALNLTNRAIKNPYFPLKIWLKVNDSFIPSIWLCPLPLLKCYGGRVEWWIYFLMVFGIKVGGLKLIGNYTSIEFSSLIEAFISCLLAFPSLSGLCFLIVWSIFSLDTRREFIINWWIYCGDPISSFQIMPSLIFRIIILSLVMRLSSILLK